MNTPTLQSPYTLEVLRPTLLKRSPSQASSLPSEQVVEIVTGIYPVDAVSEVSGHLMVTFGKDRSGSRVSFAGRNTWYIFEGHVKLTQTRQAIESPKQVWAPGGSIDWRNPNARVGKYFRVVDVTQNDSRRIPATADAIGNILQLASELDKMREEWGSGVGVTSWYRPPLVNRAVGGVANSTHIFGKAADVYPLNGRDREFEDFLDRYWGGALGYGVASGRGFTHLDTRGGGWRRGSGAIRWWY